MRRPCIRCAEPLLTMNEPWPRCINVESCAGRAAARVESILPDLLLASVPGYIQVGAASAAEASAVRPLRLVGESE